MHMIDILILGVLFVWLALSIRHMHRRRKSGKCIGCGGDCSACGAACKGRSRPPNLINRKM